jgi:hypothetical protein
MSHKELIAYMTEQTASIVVAYRGSEYYHAVSLDEYAALWIIANGADFRASYVSTH